MKLPAAKVRIYIVHLMFSGLAFAILAYWVLYHWYPGVHLKADGGGEWLVGIGGVQLVVFPFLMAFLYKKQKRGLFFDVVFLLVLQCATLVGSAVYLYSNRPLAILVFNHIAYGANKESLRFHGLSLDSFDVFKPFPALVYLEKNKNIEAKRVYKNVRYMHRVSAEDLLDVQAGYVLAFLEEKDSDHYAEVVELLGETESQIRLLPYIGKAGLYYIYVDPDSYKLELLDIRPYL